MAETITEARAEVPAAPATDTDDKPAEPVADAQATVPAAPAAPEPEQPKGSLEARVAELEDLALGQDQALDDHGKQFAEVGERLTGLEQIFTGIDEKDLPPDAKRAVALVEIKYRTAAMKLGQQTLTKADAAEKNAEEANKLATEAKNEAAEAKTAATEAKAEVDNALADIRQVLDSVEFVGQAVDQVAQIGERVDTIATQVNETKSQVDRSLETAQEMLTYFKSEFERLAERVEAALAPLEQAQKPSRFAVPAAAVEVVTSPPVEEKPSPFKWRRP